MQRLPETIEAAPTDATRTGGGVGPPSDPLRQRFRVLAEGLSDALLILDAEGITLHQSASMEAFLGHTAESRIGKNLFDDLLCHPEDDEAPRAFFDSALRQPGVRVPGRFRLRHADGSGRDVEAIGLNLLDDPDLREVYVPLRDVGDRLRAERAKAHLAAIVASSHDAILSTDLDSIIVSWNAAATRLYGYSEAEVLGRSIDIIYPPDRRSEETDLIAKLRRGERLDHFESIRFDKAGRPVEVSLAISPIHDGSGQVVGTSRIARNIGERNRFGRELRAAEEASQAKDQFLAMLSHKLRTPLTPVLATLSHVEEMADLPNILREEITSIRKNVELEARMIDDLLDVSRIGREKVTLHCETVDSHALIRAALEVCRDDIDAKGLEVSLALRARCRHAWADPTRLQQVFWNLITNAIKFTPREGRIGIQSANDDRGHLTIRVVDTGIGIDPQSLSRLFIPLGQNAGAASRKYGGLGTGLAIARMLAELHGGELTVASEGLDLGATFSVSLQAAPPPGESWAPKGNFLDQGKEKMKILLVDDDPDTLRAMPRLLKLHGYAVEVAASVREAITALDGKRFQLLLSDIGLPDGTGLEVMRHARDRYGLKGIAFSGFGSASDVDASREAGFEQHLIKPVRIARLLELIRQTAG